MHILLSRKSCLSGLLIGLLLLSGCAGSRAPAPQEANISEKSEAATPERSIDYQAAIEAYKDGDYVQSLRLFKNVKNIQDADLYYFAHALDQTGEYAVAVSVYNQYLEKLGRRGSYFLTALEARNRAQDKAEQNKQTKVKAQQAEVTLKQIGPSLEANWLVVKVQVDNRVTAFKEPLTGMEMLLVEGDCYQMGDQFDIGEAPEKPLHQVCVDDFYLGKYEVTQEQWQLVMGYNPSKNARDGIYPVEMISWQEAMDFTATLSAGVGNYRLPTEAEWEYAARSGGKKQLFSGSDNVDDVAWHEGNSGGSSQPVGQKRPNELGFHDMSGNVYEWCLDRYAVDYYQQSPQQNPTGASSGNQRTRRGGSWDSRSDYSRTSYRTERHESEYRADHTGFRLTLPATRTENIKNPL